MKKWIGALAALFLGIWVNAQDLSQISKEKPFRWTGTLNMGLDGYANSGNVPIRSDRFAWRLSGNPTAYLYGFELPFSFTLGQQIRDVRYPTFNQFGVSPTYKWVKLHAGWRNMDFSPYTLAGHSFLGGGVELTPGKFRFAAMYGRFHRAAATNAGQEYFLPTYKRMGYGVKIGVGTSNNYLDLMAFKAKDQPGSVVIPDSLGITPAENLVLGLSGRATLWRKFSLSLDGAASAYTRNQNSEEVSLDSLQMGEYYGADEVLTPRFSTRVNFAGKATMGYNSQNFGLNLGYEHIDPEYATMGAYFFNNDIENYTLSPMMAFARGKVRLFGSYGVQRNNLLGNRSETSWRNIGSANLSINPGPKFGLDLNYSNYRMNQTSTAFELSDSLKLAQATTQYSVTPRYSVFGKNAVHTFILNGVYQQLDDQNPLTEKFGDVRARVGVLTWAASFIETKLSVNTGFNYNSVQLGQTQTANYGLSAGVGKPVAKEKLTLQANGAWNIARLNGDADGAIVNASFSANWLVQTKHSLNFGLHFIRSTSVFRGKYSEWRGQIGYTWVLR
ncbi:MAG: hypothetical protein J0M29_13830 [Chitinophagales bacterium]|nr:hypothetical protein [Chitinophagales bacterium]